MPENINSSLVLKVIWMTHFILTSWALFPEWLPTAYFYTHLAVLAFGFWAIVSNESVDAALMFLVTLLFSVINDILCLSLYEPRGYNTFQPKGGSLRNEYRFALGMAITNLLLKPVTAFFLVRICKRISLGTDFNSGIPGFVGVGGSNVDSKQETVGPYARPPEHYPYQEPPTYQQTPGTDAP